MDIYFTNKLPSNIVVQPQGTNNSSPNADQAEAADPTFFKADPLQPGKVHLHSWMLYTPQAPILDLTGAHIKTKEDILMQLFMPSIYVHMMSRSLMAQKETKLSSQSKYISDSDSDENEINSKLKTSIEERQYNTIPGSSIATCIALSYSRAQVNPTVETEQP